MAVEEESLTRHWLQPKHIEVVITLKFNSRNAFAH